MKEKMNIYAEVLLKTCLKIEKGQPLFISFNIERVDFVRIVAKKAYEMGVVDIYFDMSDPILKHDAVKSLEEIDLKKIKFFEKSEWGEYAKRGAAFLMLTSQNPNLNKDLDPEKLNNLAVYANKTRGDFNTFRDASKVAWCIAAVPTLSWAKQVFPKAKDPLNKLWNAIFKVCMIDYDCAKKWNTKVNNLRNCADKLNDYRFKKLKYVNSLGTDLTIELPKEHLWASGEETLQNKKNVLVNFPTEEVFTSPLYNGVNGIVYSSKPLMYQNNLIDEFNLTFKDGKVIKVHAKKGEKALKGLINSCAGANFLGEVALVPYDSPISNTNMIFYETLFDENASCHLALGDSFAECVKNGTNLNKKELKEKGLNSCDNHVDFMIGTKDLSIIGVTSTGKEIEIFKNGNFTKEFKC